MIGRSYQWWAQRGRGRSDGSFPSSPIFLMKTNYKPQPPKSRRRLCCTGARKNKKSNNITPSSDGRGVAVVAPPIQRQGMHEDTSPWWQTTCHDCFVHITTSLNIFSFSLSLLFWYMFTGVIHNMNKVGDVEQEQQRKSAGATTTGYR